MMAWLPQTLAPLFLRFFHHASYALGVCDCQEIIDPQPYQPILAHLNLRKTLLEIGFSRVSVTFIYQFQPYFSANQLVFSRVFKPLLKAYKIRLNLG